MFVKLDSIKEGKYVRILSTVVSSPIQYCVENMPIGIQHRTRMHLP